MFWMHNNELANTSEYKVERSFSLTGLAGGVMTKDSRVSPTLSILLLRPCWSVGRATREVIATSSPPLFNIQRSTFNIQLLTACKHTNYPQVQVGPFLFVVIPSHPEPGRPPFHSQDSFCSSVPCLTLFLSFWLYILLLVTYMRFVLGSRLKKKKLDGCYYEMKHACG